MRHSDYWHPEAENDNRKASNMFRYTKRTATLAALVCLSVLTYKCTTEAFAAMDAEMSKYDTQRKSLKEQSEALKGDLNTNMPEDFLPALPGNRTYGSYEQYMRFVANDERDR